MYVSILILMKCVLFFVNCAFLSCFRSRRHQRAYTRVPRLSQGLIRSSARRCSRGIWRPMRLMKSVFVSRWRIWATVSSLQQYFFYFYFFIFENLIFVFCQNSKRLNHCNKHAEISSVTCLYRLLNIFHHSHHLRNMTHTK